MRQPQPNSSETRMDVAKALAKNIVDLFSLSSTDYAARFSVVSFNAAATLRETWSTDDAEIDAAIDAISPKKGGDTSISNGLNLAGELLGDARDSATRVVLLLTDGKQDDYLGGSAEAIAAGKNLRETVGGEVFAWGFGGDLQRDTLVAIAGDESRVRFTDDVSDLSDYLAALHAYLCHDRPAPSPPPPLPSPPPSILSVSCAALDDPTTCTTEDSKTVQRRCSPSAKPGWGGVGHKKCAKLCKNTDERLSAKCKQACCVPAA